MMDDEQQQSQCQDADDQANRIDRYALLGIGRLVDGEEREEQQDDVHRLGPFEMVALPCQRLEPESEQDKPDNIGKKINTHDAKIEQDKQKSPTKLMKALSNDKPLPV